MNGKSLLKKNNKRREKRKEMKQVKQRKGITLVALVITIIVLLILAGITISLTIGEDGIIRRTQEAGRNYQEAARNENIQLAEFINMADNILANVTGGGNTQTNRTLTSQITAADYGKSINYSVTVNGTTLSDWKVFYNDGTNVYIILDDYLDNSLIPASTGMTKGRKYVAYWDTNIFSTNTEAIATLTNTNNWSAFAAGNGGDTATGSPTNDMFVASWNENPNTTEVLSTNTRYPTLEDPTGLYILEKYMGDDENCYGYWQASVGNDPRDGLWTMDGFGWMGSRGASSSGLSLRPVVALKSLVTGNVGDTVTM